MKLFTPDAAYSVLLAVIGIEWVNYRFAMTRHEKRFHRDRLRADIARFRKDAA